MNCLSKDSWANTPKREKYQLQVKIPYRVYKWLISITKEDVRKWTPLQRGKNKQITRQHQDDLFECIQRFLKQPVLNRATKNGEYYLITETYIPVKKPFNGRMFNPDGTSGMRRFLRSVILGHTKDLDLVCSMQRTLLWVCKTFGLYAPNLAFYVEHTEKIRKELCDADGISKDDAKEKLTMAITSNQTIPSKCEFFISYDSEMKLLQKRLLRIPELSVFKRHAKKDNLEGSFLSLVYHFVEDRLIHALMDALQADGFETFCMGWDGLHIFPPPENEKLVIQRAKEVYEAICPGFNATFKFKDHDTMIRDANGEDTFRLEIDEDFNADAVDDGDAEYAFERKANEFDQEFVPVFDSFVRLTPENLDQQHQILSYSEFTKWKGHDTYRTREYNVPLKKWVYSENNFLQRWLTRHQKPFVYDNFTFIPLPGPKRPGPKEFNLFTPFRFLLTAFGASKFKLKYLLFKTLNHLKILANHSAASYHFQNKYFAQVLQFPQSKSLVLIWISDEGAGKSTFMLLWRRVIGGDKYFSTSSPEQHCWGNFNPLLANTLFLELSEINKANMHCQMNRVKDFLTSDTMSLERKGQNAVKVDNYIKSIILTNHSIPVPKSRRFGAHECSNELCYHDPTKDKKTGKLWPGCQCERCLENLCYHTEMNDDIVTSDDAAKIVGLYFLLRVKTPKSLSKADIPHTEAMELIEQASKPPLQRFLEDHVLDTIRSRDEYKKEKLLARSRGRPMIEMGKEVTDDNLIEAWTNDLWREFERWGERSCKDYLTYVENRFKFATELGKAKDKWGIVSRKKKLPGTRVNDRIWTIDIRLFCERVGLDIENTSIEEMVREDAGREAHMKVVEKQKREGHQGIDAWIDEEQIQQDVADREDCDELKREPPSADDSIPDLWLEANKFVDSLYTVNRAVRRWWAARKEDKEEDALPTPRRDDDALSMLGGITEREEVELPEQRSAREAQAELNQKRSIRQRDDVESKRARRLPSLFVERLREKGISDVEMEVQSKAD